MNSLEKEIVLFSTPDINPLAESIKKRLLATMTQEIKHIVLEYEYFTDGAPKTAIPDSVRGKRVSLILDLFNHIENQNGQKISINDKYMSMRGFVKTMKDFGAKKINVVLPSFPYARDDKYDYNGCAEVKKRKANLANLAVSDIINDGVDNLVTVDLHNDATFNRTTGTKFINLSIGWIFKHVIQSLNLDTKNLLLSGTDAGWKKKIEVISKDLHINHITTLKERDYTSDQKVEKIAVYGNCKGKDIILYDDMIDTWGTIIQAIKEIKKQGAKSINILVTHGMFHGESLTELNKLYEEKIIDSFFTTDSITHQELPQRCKVISLDILLANALQSLLSDEGIRYNDGV
jgi:ribose-phosphate pyrophosphokinase